MIKTIFFIICATFFYRDIFAQVEENTPTDTTSRSFHLITGYTYNSSHIVEFGALYRKFQVAGYHPIENNVSLSSEFILGDQFIFGPKISGWISGGAAGMALGISFINYTDFNQNEFSIRPEIGFGLFGLKAVYGYNINVFGTRFDEIGRNYFSVIFPVYSRKR